MPIDESAEHQPAEIVIALAAEQLQIDKRAIETGRVTVRVVPSTRTEEVDVFLSNQRADVERVSVERYVDEYPTVRVEDGITIVPVVEEHAVVVTKLFIREEIRIRVVTEKRSERRSMTLRSEDVDVTRVPNGQHSSNNG